MVTLWTKCGGDEAMSLLPRGAHARGADADRAPCTMSSVCKVLFVIARLKRVTGLGDREAGGCTASSAWLVREGSLRRGHLGRVGSGMRTTSGSKREHPRRRGQKAVVAGWRPACRRCSRACWMKSPVFRCLSRASESRVGRDCQ